MLDEKVLKNVFATLSKGAINKTNDVTQPRVTMHGKIQFKTMTMINDSNKRPRLAKGQNLH